MRRISNFIFQFKELKFNRYTISLTSYEIRLIFCLNNYLFLISSIIIPKDVSFIARDSFENCNILTINGYIGTYAETYAKENDFEFIAIDKTILTGDANQDGIINVNDVTYLQMHIAGKKNTDGSALIDETNKQLFNCVDMNKDGKLSVSDVTALQIYISNNNPKIN